MWLLLHRTPKMVSSFPCLCMAEMEEGAALFSSPVALHVADLDSAGVLCLGSWEYFGAIGLPQSIRPQRPKWKSQGVLGLGFRSPTAATWLHS